MARQTIAGIDVLGAYAPVGPGDLTAITFTAALNAAITGEVLSGAEPAANIAIVGTLANAPVRPGSVTIVDETGTPQAITDDGSGALIGDVGAGGTNTIDYETGAYSFSFAADVEGNVSADYTHSGSRYACTERETVLVKNNAVGAKTVTVKSQPNLRGRTGDIAVYSIAAGAIVPLPDLRRDGWADAEGFVRIDVEDQNIQFAVLRRPR
jgi:hypothetical protein